MQVLEAKSVSPYRKEGPKYRATAEPGHAVVAKYTASRRATEFCVSCAYVPGKIKSGIIHPHFREVAYRIGVQPQRILSPLPAAPISVSLERLFELLEERGNDDHGAVDPTQYAFKTASQLVLKAECKLIREVKSSPVVDSEGGIRVTWKSGNKQVKLVCPAASNAPIYIYQSSPARSIVYNQDVTFNLLADRLSWLFNGDQSE